MVDRLVPLNAEDKTLLAQEINNIRSNFSFKSNLFNRFTGIVQRAKGNLKLIGYYLSFFGW